MAWDLSISVILVGCIIGMGIIATITKNELTKIMLYAGILFQSVIGLNLARLIMVSKASTETNIINTLEVSYKFQLIIGMVILMIIIIFYIIFSFKMLSFKDDQKGLGFDDS